MAKEAKITPMMQQYYEIKKSRPDCILFFRMGDFYEMFEQDAEIASKILGITLTSRSKANDNAIPMCGIPHHSYLAYMTKLLKAGKKVAICEQLEDPRSVKGIVKRGVVRVVTPGTIIEDEALTSFDHNFLMGVVFENNKYYIAIADTSTGDVFLQKTDNIDDALSRWLPKEIIAREEFDTHGLAININPIKSHIQTIKDKVLTHFDVTTERSIGITEKGFIYALYLVLDYIQDNLLDASLKKPTLISADKELYLDAIAVSTLELISNSENGSTEGTLFSVMDHCVTSMGERMLKRWILSPLRDLDVIRRRQETVEFFVNDYSLRSELREKLKSVYDIERIISRIVAKKSNGRDLAWLRKSIENLPDIKHLLSKSSHPHIVDMQSDFDCLDEIFNKLEHSIIQEPPLTISEGGVINDGFNADVDELRDIKLNGKRLLLKIETEEKAKTGIPLKVKYNKVFGYYIEVSRANSDKVPDYFERKQTLVNAERFITDELKELESKILSSEDRLSKLEYELFQQIRNDIEMEKDRIRKAAHFISELDTLLSLAESAEKNRYIKPEMCDSADISIIDGRHPVVEYKMPEPFVPNNVFLDDDENKLHIITGPNMSGKSTYIRMVALISLMAHMGSFVPASSAKIGLIDRVFTRVGASDNLSKGESTFMVEMVETANILNNATDRSLVILDEIGRGTSTFDGVSIAWAVAEYLLNKIKAKTLFATHYHELTDIPLLNSGAKNYTIDVKEWNGEIIFLRKIIPGSTDRSYGIYVGKLAGLPKSVTDRSDEILHQLEKNEFGSDGLPKLAKSSGKTEIVHQPMLIFEENPALEILRDLDINDLTPIDALNKLNEIKKMVKD